MPLPSRKLTGAILLILFLTVYSLAAVAAAVVLQVNASPWVEVAYYLVAGLLWLPVAMWIVWWMSKSTAS